MGSVDEKKAKLEELPKVGPLMLSLLDENEEKAKELAEQYKDLSKKDKLKKIKKVPVVGKLLAKSVKRKTMPKIADEHLKEIKAEYEAFEALSKKEKAATLKEIGTVGPLVASLLKENPAVMKKAKMMKKQYAKMSK